MIPTIHIIMGPTAVGKTAVALDLAQRLSTEIISADSRQCFTELNIGVAKPAPEELALVRHHFINSHSIAEEVNAGVFETYALHAAGEIFKKYGSAVMAGGTGLYIQAFCEGIDVMPAIPALVRRTIIANYEAHGLSFLQSELREKDPEFWRIAEQQNPQRLMRALEVLHTTGKSITAFRKANKVERPFKIIKTGLEIPREKLTERINKRVEAMMENGLLKEAEWLFPYRHLNALQTVGYKELFNHFEGNCSLDEAVNQIKVNTRQYAKRQMTWFKKDKEIKWISINE